ncbi:amino acid adenylation domain-containing protein [Streptomyces sp. NPDC052192]|uniref:amino acid adenylation domain-containing protein n=1 Tax=Streptomyces sp. NPDC052192 TaxID=3155052 RepID=UPI00341786C1
MTHAGLSLLADSVRAQAARTPSEPAVEDGDRRLDYAELDAIADRVAARLRGAGILAGQAVAVALPRSWQLVCVMLGIRRHGCTVVPLDRLSPADRRGHILDDSGAVAVVHDNTPHTVPDHLAGLTADALVAAGPVSQVPAADTGDESTTGTGAPTAFLFYTSGTTGRPKGVEATDEGVLRLARPGYIGIEPGDRYACLANPAFDALSFEVWTPLLTGGTCVVLDDGVVHEPSALAEALRDRAVDTVFITVALFNAVVDQVPDCFATTRQVLVGGERVDAGILRGWYRANPGARTVLHNVYGPTETTTFALCFAVPRDFHGDDVPIGTPLAGTRCAAVTAAGTPARAGETAELVLAGEALALGYRNLPEEAARSFAPLPAGDDDTRWYRTGDLVRVDENGLVTYVGRADRQVKVRGFRIEPGEVERGIMTHPAVRHAYVCTRRDDSGRNELLAFLVPDAELPHEAYELHLDTALPAYMRPHHTYLVGELPLNANGKVDAERLLRERGTPWRAERPTESPVTPEQRTVLDLAEDVLGVHGLTPSDRWISSGGDSLAALRLRFALLEHHAADLPHDLLLRADFATIAEAVHRADAAAGVHPPVRTTPGLRSAPATSEQQRLWLLRQRDPQDRSYDVPLTFQVQGTPDPGALRDALRSLVVRHPALRTRLTVGPKGLVQETAEPYDPWRPVDERAGEGRQEAAERFFAPGFDLADPRMLRAAFLPDTDGGTLLLHLHHIAVDGWSLNLLFRDLTAAYTAALDGTLADTVTEPVVSEPAVTTLDFAAWQHEWRTSAAYRRKRGRLAEHYRATPEASPPLDPVPAAGGGAAARLIRTSVDPARAAQLDRWAARQGVTRFHLLLSAFACALYGVTGQSRPLVATPVASRPRPEFADTVGMFANTVLLPLHTAPRRGLRAQLHEHATSAATVLDGQDIALADVLDDHAFRTGGPLFDYLFVLENTEFDALRLPGCTLRPRWTEPPAAKCALTLSVVEDGSGLQCLWEYDPARVPADRVDAVARLFRTALDGFTHLPDRTVADVVAPWRTGAAATARGGALPQEFPSIAEGFARQVRHTPEAPALAHGTATLSYAQLDAAASALAAEIGRLHPLPADPAAPASVALYLDPSPEHVVALLACTRLNLTVVPLDPAYPPALLRHVLRQAQPLCVLHAPDTAPALDAVAPTGLPRFPLVLADLPPAGPDTVTRPATRPLYTLFTSGSTGVPKGVQVPDRTLCNLIAWQQREAGPAGPAVTQQFSMLSFDVSFQEIFTTLCTGGLLRLVEPDWRQDLATLLERLDTDGVERLFLPYVALQLLAEHAVRSGLFPARLREVVTAGEQLVCTDAIRQWFAGLDNARLFNHYGPTETHVVSGLCLSGDPATWPTRPAIGRPVAHAELHVVDAEDHPVPPGVTGRLLVGGPMAAPCYLGDPGLNRDRFTTGPDGGTLYRTGDLARFDAQGLLHYAGREDAQIKLSGHRLELGQVEAALLQYPGVTNAVAVAEHGRLVACLECHGPDPDPADLDRHLGELLPAHVRLGRVRRLPALPRTPSGKLDRTAALTADGVDLGVTGASDGSLSPLEARLTELFAVVTGRRPAPEQHYFDAGAGSLDLMRFHLHCTTEAGLSFRMADLFEHVTVRSLAAALTRPTPSSAPVEPAETPHPEDPTPVTAAAPGSETPSQDAIDAGPRAAVRAPRPGDTEPSVEPVAVVGMAVRLPGAPDLATFWDLVTSGRRGVEHFTAPAGRVGARSQSDRPLAFDPARFTISPHEARLMDPQQRQMLMVCVEALAHAGIADPAGRHVGLIAACGENTYFQRLIREAGPDDLPDSFRLALHHEKDFLATKAAYHLGLTGPAFSVQTACSSSLVGVHLAAQLLRQGDAEIMLAGGVLVDAELTDGYTYRPQHIFSPDGHCRAFSADAGGTVGGSGAAVVVLKPLSLARRDGDTVYALVTGSAVNNDGADKLGYSAPSLSGQRAAVRTALRRAGRRGADVGYVEAHGTGTRLGDPVEAGALQDAYDVPRGHRIAVSSVKSQIGHLGAAAGVTGLVRAVLAVHHATIPPTADFDRLNPEIDATAFRVPVTAEPWRSAGPRLAAVSSFGIGGTNAHVLVEEAPPGAAEGSTDRADRAGTGDLTFATEAAPTDVRAQDRATPFAARLLGSASDAVRAGSGRAEPLRADTPEAHAFVPLLALSAHSAPALRADARRAADHLAAHPDRYEQVVRHLRSGRPALDHRAARLLPDVHAAVDWLRTLEPVAVPRTRGEHVDARRATPEELADAWCAGRPVNWREHPVPAPWDFPPPSFDLTDYDLRRSANPEGPGFPQRLPADRWLHQKHWVRTRRARTGPAPAAGRTVVVVGDAATEWSAWAAPGRGGARVVRVEAGPAFARLGPDTYRADPSDAGQLGRIIADVSRETGAHTDWLHTLPLAVRGPVDESTVDAAVHACLDTVAALCAALADVPADVRPRPWVLTHAVQPVTGPTERPELALTAAASEVPRQELGLTVRWVDLPDAEPGHWADRLTALLADPAPTGPRLALRDGHWWQPVRLPLTETPSDGLPAHGSPARPQPGTHLVLGGTGGIGSTLAARILREPDTSVVLLSRRGELPAALAAWRDRVTCVRADLAEESLDAIAARLGPRLDGLTGVVHAAGTAHGTLLVRRDAAAARRGIAAKLRGALLTERLIATHRPGTVVYCSSMAAELGGIGQFDYAGANGLLDGFAHHTSGDDGTARTVVAWDAWREVGMAHNARVRDARHRAHLDVALTPAEGVEVFDRAMELQLPQLLVCTTDLAEAVRFYEAAPDTTPATGTAPRFEPGPEPGTPITHTRAEPPDGDPAAALREATRSLLGLDTLDEAAPLYDLGADSLTLLELLDEVKRLYGTDLDLSRLTHRVTLNEILGHLTAARPAPRTHAVAVDVWQRGTGPGVLCLVHPVGGDIQAYRALVSALPDRLTVCLIADPALSAPDAPDWSLTERAAQYLAAVRREFPAAGRQLRLAGWSFGAWAALTMAALAEEAGEAPGALYLLDPPSPDPAARPTVDEEQVAAVFALELRGNRADHALTEQGRAYAERLAQCCRANLAALAGHRLPRLTRTRGSLWLAQQPVGELPVAMAAPSTAAEWEPRLPAAFRTHHVPVTHYELVADPHVRAVAEVIAGDLTASAPVPDPPPAVPEHPAPAARS